MYCLKYIVEIDKRMDSIDKKQLINLVVGTISLLTLYCFAGILHEHLINIPYPNFQTGKQEILPSKAILVLAPTLITYLIGKIYNRSLEKKTQIPQKNSLICGAIVFISTITYTWATSMTSFPVVMAFKSCNILSILLVAVLCSRVKDKNLKLGANKIIVGIVISVGVFLFSIFDPEKKNRTQQSQVLGIVLLFVSLLADGFLPDFQAEIKSNFKPQPTQMMQQINKWVAIISLASMIGSLTIQSALQYCFYHPRFVIDLIGLSILSAAGQFVVYTMIKLFKQHIVPFVITVRKILTVVISILFYNHQTSVLQIIGMLIVVVAVVFQFGTQIRKTQQGKGHQSENKQIPIELNEEQIVSQQEFANKNQQK